MRQGCLYPTAHGRGNADARIATTVIDEPARVGRPSGAVQNKSSHGISDEMSAVVLTTGSATNVIRCPRSAHKESLFRDVDDHEGLVAKRIYAPYRAGPHNAG